MELNAIQTRRFAKSDESDINDYSKSESRQSLPLKPSWSKPITPDTAVQILKSQPPHDDLLKTLTFLLQPPPNASFPSSSSPNAPTATTNTPKLAQNLNIKVPNSKTAQIIHVLVNDILPAHWVPLDPSSPDKVQRKIKRLLVKCLQSVTGLGALISRLRALLELARNTSAAASSSLSSSSSLPSSVARNGANAEENTAIDKRFVGPLGDVIEVLEDVLKGDKFLLGIWRDGGYVRSWVNEWKEILAMVAGGRFAFCCGGGGEGRWRIRWGELGWRWREVC